METKLDGQGPQQRTVRQLYRQRMRQIRMIAAVLVPFAMVAAATLLSLLVNFIGALPGGQAALWVVVLGIAAKVGWAIWHSDGWDGE